MSYNNFFKKLFFPFLTFGIASVVSASEGPKPRVWFSEDFDGKAPSEVRVFFRGARKISDTKIAITRERSFSGSASACVESSAIAYFEIPLRQAIEVRNLRDKNGKLKPLYLSARVFAEKIGDAKHNTYLGVNMSTRSSTGTVATGMPLSGGIDSSVNNRRGSWIQLVFDISERLQESERKGVLNPDQVLINSVALLAYGGGKFYIDDIRLANTPPDGWKPANAELPAVDARAYFRRDPKLEAMVLHGVWGGVGSALTRDISLHPFIVRDLLRLYMSFAGPSVDYRYYSTEARLQEISRIFERAEAYELPVMLCSYIGSRYSPQADSLSEEELKASMTKIAERFKASKGMLAWYLEEEPGAERAVPYLREKRWIDEVDPNHSCLMIFNSESGLDAIGPAQSVIFRDIYSIHHPPVQNPWMVPVQVARHVRDFPQPFVLTIQAFGGEGQWAVPSLGQYRLMAYGALVEGAKGLHHFLYSAPPFFEQKLPVEYSLYGGLTDPYGTPTVFHGEIARRLGPTLFSIGELLRTSRPQHGKDAVSVTSRWMIDVMDYKRPAIAYRILEDREGRYQILGLYNNNPDGEEVGTVKFSQEALDGCVLLDLTKQSEDLVSGHIHLISETEFGIKLAGGEGHFYALVPKTEVDSTIARMRRVRFEAVRRMVRFDINWLEKIGKGNAEWSAALDKAKVSLDRGLEAQALAELYQLDSEIQRFLAEERSLRFVTDCFLEIRNQLSHSYKIIVETFGKVNITDASEEAGKLREYVRAQQELGKLYVGFGDLIFAESPEKLTEIGKALVSLAVNNCELWKEIQSGKRASVDFASLVMRCKNMQQDLVKAGWVRPPTTEELGN